ncbi:MAG: hypothetical protein KDC09_17345 [Bacteroidales bacterium]|nr:hypothetical protein [Bacteroidales bacterium]
MYKWITGGTANKDFIGLRKIESWFNFSCSLTGKNILHMPPAFSNSLPDYPYAGWWVSKQSHEK